jgi:large subunit ribosomal protein L11
MGEQRVESLIEGGQATAAPPLGPALGPLGVNIGEVVEAINEKTESFDGMQVPIAVVVDTDTKEYEIEVGTPPAAALIMKEAKLDKGSGRPAEEHVANIKIEQAIKIADMKKTDLLGKDNKGRVKEIVGTCNSMGVMVEGKHAADTIQDIDAGEYDTKIENEKTELSEEELKELEEQKEKLQKRIKKRHEKEITRAEEIADSMEGQERGEIVAVMREEEIPEDIINEVIPPEHGAEMGMAKQGGPTTE